MIHETSRILPTDRPYDVRQDIRDLVAQTREVIRKETSLAFESVLLIGRLDSYNAAVNLGIPASEFPAHLGLTPDQYGKRLQASRVVRMFPGLYNMLKEGRTHIAHLALVAPKITEANAALIEEELPGKSKRELALFLSRVTRDGRLGEGEAKVELTVTLTRAELDLLDRAKEVLSAAGHVPRTKEILVQALESLLESRDPLRKAQRAMQRKERLAAQARQIEGKARDSVQTSELEKPQLETGPAMPRGIEDEILRRDLCPQAEESQGVSSPADAILKSSSSMLSGPPHGEVSLRTPRDPSHAPGHDGKITRRKPIPAAVRHEVMLRDQGQCTEILADGRRCPERGMIELDHTIMVCRGGGGDINNIVIKCRTHNQAAARRELGDGWMNRFAGKHKLRELGGER